MQSLILGNLNHGELQDGIQKEDGEGRKDQLGDSGSP